MKRHPKSIALQRLSGPLVTSVSGQLLATVRSTSIRARFGKECSRPQAGEVVLPEPGSTEHERELFALELLAGGAIPPAIRSLPATSATLSASGCTACGVCTRACPEGALAIERSEDAFTLREAVRACIDCGECVRLCPENVLGRTGSASWGDVVDDRSIVVEQGPARTCARCRANFRPTGDEEHCPTCIFRLANPFGSQMRQ